MKNTKILLVTLTLNGDLDLKVKVIGADADNRNLRPVSIIISIINRIHPKVKK